MRRTTIRFGTFAIIAVTLIGFLLSASHSQSQARQDDEQQDQAQQAGDADAPESALRKRVLAAAHEYKEYGRVDDEARWAPYLCRSPMRPEARVSQSEDDETHGGSKLYFMYARDRFAYVAVNQDDVPLTRRPANLAPEQQVIVKESWKPAETDGPVAIERRYWLSDEERQAVEKYINDETRGTLPIATHGDKTFYAKEKAALFLMLRAEENNPWEMENSVKGWVFATTTPDGKEITALGKIESCAGCHQDAPHGGLFGIPGDFTRW